MSTSLHMDEKLNALAIDSSLSLFFCYQHGDHFRIIQLTIFVESAHDVVHIAKFPELQHIVSIVNVWLLTFAR